MAKVLQLSRPSRRVGSLIRTWCVLRQQKRRRERAGAAVPPVPVAVITDGSYVWDATVPGWADVTLNWTADTSGWPGGIFELWFMVGEVPVRLVSLLDSARMYVAAQATAEPCSLLYRVRYVRGETEGAFSNEYEVVVGGLRETGEWL